MQAHPSRKRTRWYWVVLGLGFVLLILLCARWWVAERRAEAFATQASAMGERVHAKPRRAVDTVASSTTRPQSGANQTSAANAPSATALRAQLPPRDQPLLKTAPQLHALANAGNYFASCRLAVETLFCIEFRRGSTRKIEKLRDTLERLPEGDPSRPTLIASVAEAEIEAAQQSSHCDGFDAKAFEKPWRLLLQASLQGHLASTDFFLIPYWIASDIDSPISAIDAMDALAAYRLYAPSLLVHAAERGWPTATRMLAYEHSGRGLFSNIPLLSQFSLAEPDPVRAYAFAHAHTQAERMRDVRARGMERALGEWASSMPEDDLSRARELGDSLLRSWGSEVLQQQTPTEGGSKIDRMSDVCLMSN